MWNFNKIIDFILCALLVVGCIPAANAAQTAGEPECPVCGAVTWTAWDGTAPTADAHVYIPEGGLEIGGKDITTAVHFVLDLRGNALTSTIQTFRLRAAGADVHFIDSVGTGSITSKASAGRHGGIMQFMAAGTLTVHGGTYGLSEDNVFNSTANTGGLFNFNSSAGATMNILGGTFNPGKAKLGDSIYVFGTGNTLNIGGNAVINGGVYVDNAKTVTISGTPTIRKLSGGSAYSLTTKVPMDCTGLRSGANIGITADGTFTTEFADAAAAEAAKTFFTADDTAKNILVEGKTLKVADKPVQVATKELYCQHCEQTVAFSEWNGKAPTTDGHFYVPENGLTLSARVTPGKITMVLDLNGQTLDSTITGKMFQINVGTKLILQDSSAEKTGTMISKASATGNAGAVQLYGGNMDIYGGTYKLSDTANTAKSGGLIYASQDSTQPVLNIYGGTFYGANAAEGGAIRASNTHLTITGGTFYAGSATAGDTIMVRDANTRLVISGDPVIEGGLEIKSGLTFSISGKPVILKKAEGGSAYSLKLADGIKVDWGTLEEGAKIGLTGNGIIAENIAATPDAANQAAQNIFVADEAGKLVTSKGTDLIITTPSAEATFDCPHCDETVTWTAWDPTASHAAGHYYLTKNETFSGTNSMSSGTMVLNLNGYTLDSTVKLLTIGSNAEVVLMDSSADQTGIVAGTARATSHAGIIQVNGGALEIWGGNYYLKDSANTTSKNGGLVYVGAGGSLAVHDGAFWGGNTDNGGAFDINNGHLSISGGRVYAGTATTKGDSIRINNAASTLTISGSPVICGGVYVESAASVEISGSPVIRMVEGGTTAYSMKTEVPVTVGALSGNAKIGISSEGVFTTAFADEAAAKAAAKYFFADDSATKAIKLSGTALSLEAYTDATEDLNHPANDDELNILLIGNSYSYYWSEELYMLLTAAGYKNVTVANVYYSGCTFEKHWTWHENGTAPENYLLCIADKNGYRQIRDTELTSNLAYKKWDAISFQQSGSYIYGEDDPMNTFRNSMEPWLGNLYALAAKDHPHAKYHWLQSWAHELGNGVKTLEEQEAVTNVHRTIGKEICEKYGFTRVPCGDAWELVRHDPIIKADGMTLTTRINYDAATFAQTPYEDDLTHDGDVGGGQFLNACVWFEVLTGKSVLDVSVAPYYIDPAGQRHDLSAAKVDLLKNAAHTAVQAIYGQPDPDQPDPDQPDVIRGDMDGDGAVSDADAMYLLRYTLFGDTRYPLNQSGDVDGDNAVSDADAMYLLRFTLFGPSRYPLH